METAFPSCSPSSPPLPSNISFIDHVPTLLFVAATRCNPVQDTFTCSFIGRSLSFSQKGLIPSNHASRNRRAQGTSLRPPAEASLFPLLKFHDPETDTVKVPSRRPDMKDRVVTVADFGAGFLSSRYSTGTLHGTSRLHAHVHRSPLAPALPGRQHRVDV